MMEVAPINSRLLQKEVKIVSASKAKKQKTKMKDKNYQSRRMQRSSFTVYSTHVGCCHVSCVACSVAMCLWWNCCLRFLGCCWCREKSYQWRTTHKCTVFLKRRDSAGPMCICLRCDSIARPHDD